MGSYIYRVNLKFMCRLICFLVTLAAVAANMAKISCIRNQILRMATYSVAMLCFERNSFATEMLGQKLFENSCSSCHENGGNIIPFYGDKNLQKSALLRNGYVNADRIVDLLQSGKGAMPAFGEFVSPKGKIYEAKLSNEDMKLIADYILTQSENGWK